MLEYSMMILKLDCRTLVLLPQTINKFGAVSSIYKYVHIIFSERTLKHDGIILLWMVYYEL